MFIKIGVLKKIAIFTGKNLYWSLFDKVESSRPATLLNRDSNTGVSPANIAELLRTAFFVLFALFWCLYC